MHLSHAGARIAISEGMVTIVAKNQSILENTQEKVFFIHRVINLMYSEYRILINDMHLEAKTWDLQCRTSAKLRKLTMISSNFPKFGTLNCGLQPKKLSILQKGKMTDFRIGNQLFKFSNQIELQGGHVELCSPVWGTSRHMFQMLIQKMRKFSCYPWLEPKQSCKMMLGR